MALMNDDPGSFNNWRKKFLYSMIERVPFSPRRFKAAITDGETNKDNSIILFDYFTFRLISASSQSRVQLPSKSPMKGLWPLGRLHIIVLEELLVFAPETTRVCLGAI